MTPLLRSSLLTTRHGFSTRLGGVSTGRYASMNPSAKWGDDPALVDENRKRLAAAGGFDRSRLFTAKQVHGSAIVRIAADSTPAEIAAREADVLITDVPEVAVGVFTADCVPILATDGVRVGAAHAGWRGTVKNVAGVLLDALVALGARRDQLRVAIGPSLCVRCFEVGEEVAAQFPLEAVRRDLGAKPRVDLWLANKLRLTGVAEIDLLGRCTMCEPDTFFSFRRDGGQVGQQLSFIVVPGSS